MADQTYVYNGTGAFYGQTIIIKDGWPENIKKMWLDAIVKSYTIQVPAWFPEYDTITVTWPGEGGSLASFIQPFDLEFPTAATVQHLADLYGATVSEIPFFSGGPTGSTAVKRFLNWPNKTIEAWPLANAYTNNPPELADKMCKGLILGAVMTSEVSAEDAAGTIGGIVQLLPTILQLIAAFASLFAKKKPAA